jgi:NAD(P)-dependent dehydrogenase (short-subunit alcohol dehydrogenase family)
MLLDGKQAVIYGGGGAIGRVVAKTFAREGAAVHLAGRTRARLDDVAQEIVAAGGRAETASVDALDEAAVARPPHEVVARAGRIDVLFNAIAMDDVQGVPLVEMPLDDFMQPIAQAMKTQFLTTRVIGRHMMRQRAGVILTLTATPARMAFALCGGFGVACAAIEGLCRTLAAELGPSGIRVVCLRSAGSPETPGMLHATSLHAQAAGRTTEDFLRVLDEQSLLKRTPTVAEVAETAAFLASDRAGAMTATVANLTCGAIAD